MSTATLLSLSMVVGLLCGFVAPPLWMHASAIALLCAATYALYGRRHLLVGAVAAMSTTMCLGFVSSNRTCRPLPGFKHSVHHVIYGQVHAVSPDSALVHGHGIALADGHGLHPLRSFDAPARIRLPDGQDHHLTPGSSVILRVRSLGSRRLRNFRDPPRLAPVPTGVLVAGPVVLAPAGQLSSVVHRARGAVRDALRRALAPQARGIVMALVIGDRSELRAEDVLSFRRSGVAHLLAVSGLHLLFVGGAAYFFLTFLLQRTPLARACRVGAYGAAGAILVVWGYAFLTGLAPPVFRAAIMATSAFVSVMIGRKNLIFHSVTLAGACLLVWQPDLLFRASFQLSFAAVVALAVAARKLPPTPSIVNKAVRAVRASVAPAGGTAGFVAHHFGQVTPWAPVVNLVAVPASAFALLPACFGITFVALLWPEGAAFLGEKVMGPAVEHFVVALTKAATLPGGVLTGFRPTFFEALCATVAAIMCFGKRWQIKACGLLFAVGIGCLAYARIAEPARTEQLRVTFFDVGAGDATLVDFPGGGRLLLDTGPSKGTTLFVPPVIRAVEQMGAGRLDVIAISHRHEDHVLGLDPLLTRIGADRFWLPYSFRDGVTDPLALRAGGAGAALVDTSRRCGSRSLGGLTVEILHPCGPEDAHLSENDRSLVLRLRFGETSVLLPGDIEGDGEALLVSRYGQGLRSTVLKLPHHGSRTSSGPALLEAVAPQLAVVSCGRSFSRPLPHREVARRLHDLGIPFVSTAELGAVSLSTDGQRYSLAWAADP